MNPSQPNPYQLKPLKIAIALGALMSLSLAHATDGYFSTGYGIKSQGEGGVGIASPQDALSGASNPAGISQVDSRVDLGVTLFRPERSSTITGNAGGNAVNGTYDGNRRKNFVIPDLAVVKTINPKLKIGLNIYGNGGMNTAYTTAVPLLGSSQAGVNLEQLFISPTAAYKISERHALGASLIYARQKFSATGLENFTAYSTAPNNVTNLGNDTTHGFGFKLGWLGQLSDSVTVGAAYQSKISGRFDKYKGLFAEQGGFDIPANYGVGISFKAHPKWTIDADVQRILYSQTASVGNGLSNLTVQGQPLGSSNGPGFGWSDVTVFKLGTRYQAGEKLILRAGYNYNTQPIPSSQTLFNILAPGTVQHHISIGATYALKKDLEVSGYYSHAFAKTVAGQQSIPAAFGGGEANIRLSENLFGLSLGWKY